ncbi:MAG TPA: hypothetical protein VJ729_18555 [Nitrososphaeraceae archaeon]|nr:hypothetical protein [Nitrososphaeraceae archaeon]
MTKIAAIQSSFDNPCPRLSRSLIFVPVYKTTISTSTNGIAAETERETRIIAAAEEAAPEKYPTQTIIRKRVVSVGRLILPFGCFLSVQDSESSSLEGYLGSVRVIIRGIRFERVPVIMVVLLFKCFAQMNCIPIDIVAIRGSDTSNIIVSNHLISNARFVQLVTTLARQRFCQDTIRY